MAKISPTMRSTYAIRQLGGTIIEASHWLGVVAQAVRYWARDEVVKPGIRDRVIAAMLRKAAAQALGITSRHWWADEDIHNERLERVLSEHNDRFVGLFRELFAEKRDHQVEVNAARSGTSPESASAPA